VDVAAGKLQAVVGTVGLKRPQFIPYDASSITDAVYRLPPGLHVTACGRLVNIVLGAFIHGAGRCGLAQTLTFMFIRVTLVAVNVRATPGVSITVPVLAGRAVGRRHSWNGRLGYGDCRLAGVLTVINSAGIPPAMPP